MVGACTALAPAVLMNLDQEFSNTLQKWATEGLLFIALIESIRSSAFFIREIRRPHRHIGSNISAEGMGSNDDYWTLESYNSVPKQRKESYRWGHVHFADGYGNDWVKDYNDGKTHQDFHQELGQFGRGGSIRAVMARYGPSLAGEKVRFTPEIHIFNQTSGLKTVIPLFRNKGYKQFECVDEKTLLYCAQQLGQVHKNFGDGDEFSKVVGVLQDKIRAFNEQR